MSVRPNNDFDARERLLHLPLAHPTRAEQEFIQLFDATVQSPPDGIALFETLEQIRSSLCFVREAAARHYLEDAPHLDPDRETHFQRGIEAIRRMVGGYASCAGVKKPWDPARLAANPRLMRLVATALHRSLYYSGMLIFEHYRAKRELSPGLWLRHHTLFAAASRMGVGTLSVEDRLFDESRITHCQAAFVTPLLAEQAGPYGRNSRELNLIWRWAETVASKVDVRPFTASPTNSAFAVNLGQDAPLGVPQGVENPGTCRQLDTTGATRHLQRILDGLAQGISPERVGLCDETIEESKGLLEQLIALWSLDTPQRRSHPRISGRGTLRLCAGFSAMHHFVLGADRQPNERAQLKHIEKNAAPPHQEEWDIIDQSVSGFRLASGSSGIRLMPRQLVALGPDESGGYRLGLVAWLRREQSGRLLAGIAIVAGTPQAVAARPLSQAHGRRHAYSHAFLLRRETAQADEGDTILLPASFRELAGRLDVFHHESRLVGLGKEIRRGRDFVQLAIDRP
ncbi:MAG: hypothetical protein H6R10_2150 [Rhodocyclaceae bacterium]|nr:hypothetical protein [Rhodocyclaceae bacterium]